MPAPVPTKPQPLGGSTRKPIIERDTGMATRDFIKWIQNVENQITALRKKAGI